MTQNNTAQPDLSKGYLIGVLLLMVIMPVVSILSDVFRNGIPLSMALAGKWFIFWAVGIRLFTAGFKQAFQPQFTARNIFHLTDESSYPIVRELGYANICFGTIGILSLFIAEWRIVSAVASGIFYGIAGANHIIKKPAGANEMVALITDLFIFLFLLAYVIIMW